MTEDQKREIAVLASDYAAKSEILRGHEAANTSPDPSIRERQRVEYHIAEAAAWEARDRLDRAKRALLL